MESMKQNDVLPEVATFNQFIFNLLHNNGDIVAAQHIIEVDIPAAGIEPDYI